VDGPVTEAGEAIISIHPKFANAILAGTKTVELRRRIPPIKIGTRLWIYATQPIGAVIGTVTVEAIVRATPDVIWDMCADRADISRLEFDRYFSGSSEAIGISLGATQKIEAIEIEKLRTWRVGFHPPQVMLKITASEAKSLLKLVSNATKLHSATAERAD
jgi:predicted transcriptional regulator